MTLRLLLITTLLAAGFPALSAAQSSPGNAWRYGTTLSGFAGAAAEDWHAHPAAGLAVGWDVHKHVAVEGSALWTMPASDRNDFAVLIGPRINFLHSQRAVPFASVGVGMYRASFDRGVAGMPQFYARRVQGGDVMTPGRTFDDFVTAVGGGAELFVGEHWAVQPDARVLIVSRNAERRFVTAIGAHLAYHFQSRTITR